MGRSNQKNLNIGKVPNVKQNLGRKSKNDKLPFVNIKINEAVEIQQPKQVSDSYKSKHTNFSKKIVIFLVF